MTFFPLSLVPCRVFTQTQVWRKSGFADFRDGSFGDGYLQRRELTDSGGGGDWV